MSNLTILTILTLLSAVFIIILFTTALLSDNYCGAQRFDAKIKISSFTISEISVFIWTTYTTTHFLGQLIGITKSKMFKIKFWVGCGLHTLPQKTCTKLSNLNLKSQLSLSRIFMESETLPSTFGVIRSLRLLPFLSAAWLDSSQPLWSVDTRKLLVCSLHQVQVHLKL